MSSCCLTLAPHFSLISNICSNRMHDMEMGDVKWDDAEYNRLESLKAKADELFCAMLPIAWLPWEDLKAARELTELAVEHRVNACVEAGRRDLIRYC